MMKQITEKDRALLSLLQKNARESVSSLARLLGVSRSTVQDRITRLEEEDIIAGYSVRLSDKVRLSQVKAQVMIEAEARHSAGLIDNLRTMPQVEALFTVSGRFDFMAILAASTTEEIDGLLDRIGSLPGTIRTESAIILSTKFDRRLF